MRYLLALILTLAPICNLKAQILAPILMGQTTNATGGTPFILAVSGTPRNNFTGALGYEFEMSSTQTITQLGRLCLSGNSATHTIYVVNAAGNTVLANASVNMSGCTAGTFVYASISSLTLANSTYYFVLSSELNSGDTFTDATTTFTVTAGVATVEYAAYTTSIPPTSGITLNGNLNMYVPPNFQF